jgi:hypothetical protein
MTTQHNDQKEREENKLNGEKQKNKHRPASTKQP